MNKFISLSKSLISILTIYLLIIMKMRHKRIIMFYFPVKIYQENLFDLIKLLEKKNDIFLVYNSSSKFEISRYDNSYFLDFDLIKYIPFSNFFLKGIKIFVSSYMVYVYPPKSINIYISHDIYDAPMVNKNLEKKIFLRINKLDYIFLSSKISVEYFKSQFKKFKIRNNPKLVNTGYLKLDNLINKIKFSFNKNKLEKVLIAPGYSYAFKQYNMYSKIEKIIYELLNNSNEQIVFRPHPLDLTKKGDIKKIKSIIFRFKKYKNFTYDLSVSYLKSYKESKILITDLSSTAYTYAFSNKKPVIFFSKNENKLQNDYFSSLNYFKDRTKIGFVVSNVKNILNVIKKMKLSKSKLKRKIIKLRKERILYLGKSVKKTSKEIDAINTIKV